MSSPKIIFEDKDLLVLDKPAGMVVNRSQTTEKIFTLQDWVSQYLGLKDLGIGQRAGIVHRLDKETSGIILVAKTLRAFTELQSQFKEREIRKKYVALVHGIVASEVSTIRAAIGRSPFNRKKFGIFLGGKEAETDYLVKKTFNLGKQGAFSLLDIFPKTGRTHQIRVHLKFIGHPVVGDKLYAGRKMAKGDFGWCKRQFLHASGITFRHPTSNKAISLDSSLPAELDESLETLQQPAKALN